MQRRKFSREFKLEAVKLVRERGVSVAQAARDLDLHENVLRKWVRDHAADPGSALRCSNEGASAIVFKSTNPLWRLKVHGVSAISPSFHAPLHPCPRWPFAMS